MDRMDLLGGHSIVILKFKPRQIKAW